MTTMRRRIWSSSDTNKFWNFVYGSWHSSVVLLGLFVKLMSGLIHKKKILLQQPAFFLGFVPSKSFGPGGLMVVSRLLAGGLEGIGVISSYEISSFTGASAGYLATGAGATGVSFSF